MPATLNFSIIPARLHEISISTRKVVKKSLKVLKKVQLLHQTSSHSSSHFSPTCCPTCLHRSKPMMTGDSSRRICPRCSCLIHRLNSAWVSLLGSISLDSSPGQYYVLFARQVIPCALNSDSSYIVSQQLVCVKINLPTKQTSNIHYARSRTPCFSLGSSNSPSYLDSIWMAAHN